MEATMDNNAIDEVSVETGLKESSASVATTSADDDALPQDDSPAVAAVEAPAKKRASTGGNRVKSTSISSKVPPYLAKTSKGTVNYFTMVHEAIVELGDRTGSSVPAITKYMKSKHYELNSTKPKSFQQSVNNAIKSGLKENKLIRVKASFKINKQWLDKEKAAFRAKEAKKKAMERKKKKDTADQKKKVEAAKKAEEAKKKKLLEEDAKKKLKTAQYLVEKAKKELEASQSAEEKAAAEKKELEKKQAAQKKEEDRKRQKAIEEKVKKRRFPMDDLALIAEDKELGVKRPSDVTRSPFLPFALQTIVPHDIRARTKKTTPGAVINACIATDASASRCLFTDVLQVYHFFVGDVGYGHIYEGTVPIFTLRQLLYAVNEVSNGNAKKSRVVPPLISHLFVTALFILTSPTAEDWVSDDETDHTNMENLKADLKKLGDSLNETSWGETMFCYMGVMEKFYSSDASQAKNAVPGFPIMMVEEDVSGQNSDNDTAMTAPSTESDLPSGYSGYIGSSDCALNKGYQKLSRHDPWNLAADEMMAILRVLTDDVLAMKPTMSKIISDRNEKILELFKKKKAGESLYRKVRLAHLGPKWPNKSKSKKDSNGEKDLNEENEDDKDSSTQEKSKFKPTATKAEFDAATKTRDKAVEQYEKGLKNLVPRSGPFGYDKSRSAFYVLHNDPDAVFVEVVKTLDNGFHQVKSWHCIDSKPLFESVVSSLDIRGIRESALYDTMTGYSGHSSMKRHLYDSNRKNNLISAYKRQEESLEKRLHNAVLASTESTRRSGRLASNAKDEVTKIQEEMEEARATFESQLEALETVDDFSVLTGAKLLSDFELNFRYTARCSQLWNDTPDKPGIIGKIADSLLDLEDTCESLAPWEKTNSSRSDWIKNIEETAEAWHLGCSLHIGSKVKNDGDLQTPSKKQRISPEMKAAPSISYEHVLSMFKGPLIDLEARIYSITGIERAVKEVDEANDNMSVASDGDSEEKEVERVERTNYAWKKKIYTLNSILSRRASTIREVIISAIAIARKAELTNVLEDLRACLALHKPGAGGRARSAALGLLEKYGFELKEDDIDMMDTEDSLSEIEPMQDSAEKGSQESTFLPSRAMMLCGSLEGDSNADRVDWKDAVTTCKTVSRFAALLATLKTRASPMLAKCAKDKKTLLKAINLWDTNVKTRKGKTKKVTAQSKKFTSATEIWENVQPTNNFVTSKVFGFPWWPARECIPKDNSVRESLEALNRTMVSFVGEQHLYVVDKTNEIRPFTPKVDEEDAKNISPETLKNIKNSIDLARRILKGRGLGGQELTIDNGLPVEEKKSSS